MTKNIFLVCLSCITFSCATSVNLKSSEENDAHFRPIVTPLVISELKRRFPKDGSYWAGNDLVELKNGEPLTVDSFEVNKEKIQASEYRGPIFVQIRGAVTFKQGDKLYKSDCLFAFDVQDETPSLHVFRTTTADLSANKNPDCKDADSILTKDPIKDFRKNKKLRAAINDRTVYIGMPEEALEASLGPIGANETNYRGKVTKQYLNHGQYIYVEDGKVFAIQE
jgi:hypothetical protein